MATINQSSKQVLFIFIMNLPMTIFAISILIKAIETGISWKIICSAISVFVLLSITVLLYFRVLKLKKGA
jgi:hypothetical protein